MLNRIRSTLLGLGGGGRLGMTLGILMLLVTAIPISIQTAVVAVTFSDSIGSLEAGLLSTRHDVAEELIGARLRGQAATAIGEVDAYMRERLLDLVDWSLTPLVHQAAREANAGSPGAYPMLDAYLRDLIARHPALVQVLVTDLDANVIAPSDSSILDMQAGQSWFQLAMEYGIYVGPVYLDPVTNRPIIEIATRLQEPSGDVLGAFRAVLSIEELQGVVSWTAKAVADGKTVLFDRDGYQIAQTGTADLRDAIMTDAGNLFQQKWDPASYIDSRGDGRSGHMLDQSGFDGRDVVLGYATSADGEFYGYDNFDGLGWRLAVQQPEGVAFSALRRLDLIANRMEMERQSLLTLMGTLCTVAAVISMAAAVAISRWIVRPMVKLAETSQRLSDGDLSVPVVVDRKNEIGQLQASFGEMALRLKEMLESERDKREHLESTVDDYLDFVSGVASGDLTERLSLAKDEGNADHLVRLGHNLNLMVDYLREMAYRLRQATGNVNTAATEILASTAQQVSSSSEQSAAISQTSTTVDEVRAIAEQTVERAQEVADSGQRSIDFSRAGNAAVRETIDSMALIRQRVEGIAENILALSERTQQIGDIIATVDEIASQSKMLALNASVEAARAGEQGKGFSVVALEVRSLAERSQQATMQVREILSEIQAATNVAVMATEEGTKGVDEGLVLSQRTGDVIEQLGAALAQSAGAASQMVAGGRQQSSGVEQIALAMANINQATVQSLASTRQAEKAAQDLHELANSLSEIVDGYQI